MSFQRFAKGRLTTEIWDELSWPDVVAAFTSTSVDERKKFIAALKSRKPEVVARVLLKIIQRAVDSRVDAEYADITADGSLSPAELERIFK